jgi:ribosomal protein S18 acetylase RimI-like enzyme
MPVTVLRIPATGFTALPACRWTVVAMAACDLASGETARLLGAAASASVGFPPLAAAGLAADVRGRQNRTVRAWAAVRPEGSIVALIGLAEATVTGDRRFSIPWLVVHPSDRRRGTGAAMAREALAAAAIEGAVHVTVETLTTWAAARAFWEAILARTQAAC